MTEAKNLFSGGEAFLPACFLCAIFFAPRQTEIKSACKQETANSQKIPKNHSEKVKVLKKCSLHPLESQLGGGYRGLLELCAERRKKIALMDSIERVQNRKPSQKKFRVVEKKLLKFASGRSIFTASSINYAILSRIFRVWRNFREKRASAGSHFFIEPRKLTLNSLVCYRQFALIYHCTSRNSPKNAQNV